MSRQRPRSAWLANDFWKGCRQTPAIHENPAGHCLNWRLKRYLPGHMVQATFEMGWDAFRNGRLLTLAETQFDVFLTVDKGIKYQQNFAGRDIAVITLRGRDNKIETHIPLMPQVLALLPTVQPGQVYVVAAEDAAAAEA